MRRAEEVTAEIYPSDKIKSPVHLSIGQESVTVGVVDAISDDDYVAGSYRCHAAYIAKGGDLGAMYAEMYGKSTGCAKGRGGSMHLIEPGHNVIGASAVVGTHIPVAVGHALALKNAGEGQMVVVFFGDGATEEGVFYESLNFASLHKFPILFVCENNGFAIHTPLEKRWATNSLCERVKTFGIPAERVCDGDVFAIRDAALSAVAAIRQGDGPHFMECETYRWREHVGPYEDYDDGYRARDDQKPWVQNDQVARLAEMLDEETREKIDAEIELEIAAAVDFAETSPAPNPEELWDFVYAD
jgi:TPP-dependent pyruvate/acetoin dehydrogenase alpha subunit